MASAMGKVINQHGRIVQAIWTILNYADQVEKQVKEKFSSLLDDNMHDSISIQLSNRVSFVKFINFTFDIFNHMGKSYFFWKDRTREIIKFFF
jgi:hypothetical protein